MVIFDLPKDEEIVDFEKLVLGQAYRFTDRAFIREALQGPSIYNHDGQKTLALVGDAILRQSLVDQGRERSETPGEIQNVITKVASNDNLYDRGIALGLDPFIVKNPGQWGITAGKKTMATTMEAIIGAVFYDSAKNGDDLKRVLTALGLAWPE
ncbi:hypothetical protein N7489_008170 [Penicillium chrysogenum]|uniref:RNase III domain-containing protein n=1 Tax=Penicillium chrysogenum TaxID=5076 RepID=A0ABQ8WA03_PENCH|nr:uncharacterized protein N7489_008170 [Penicillium chrysogenum]KAJ5238079.1 hypothetical protein N7489_008170 [Penicillium chrysogenum]KAJ5261666.1 hypothetical protein N7505_008533 [Penicillium chrysogenum]KAJ5278379.1 hypothetical protein N7524_004532 [Penicillium chrysogenum]